MIDGRLRYRLLTGPDTVEFCQRVSQALANGYELAGSPAIAHDGERAVVAQAVVLPTAGVAAGDDDHFTDSPVETPKFPSAPATDS